MSERGQTFNAREGSSVTLRALPTIADGVPIVRGMATHVRLIVRDMFRRELIYDESFDPAEVLYECEVLNHPGWGREGGFTFEADFPTIYFPFRRRFEVTYEIYLCEDYGAFGIPPVETIEWTALLHR